eukprot:877-Heterococcus_DN1.PRE.3
MTVAYKAIKDVSDVFDVPENNEHIQALKRLTLQPLLTLLQASWTTFAAMKQECILHTVHACATVGRHTAATHTHAAVSDQSLNNTKLLRLSTVAQPLVYLRLHADGDGLL